MRLVLFTLSIGVILVSVGLAAISAASPNWFVMISRGFAAQLMLLLRISFESPQDSPITLRTKYGLFQRCDQSILDKSVWACRRCASRNGSLYVHELICVHSVPKQDSDCRRPLFHDLSASVITSHEPELLPNDKTMVQKLVKTQSRPSLASTIETFGEHGRRRRDYKYTSFCSLWRLAGQVFVQL